MPLNAKITAREVRALYEERYAGEKLVKIRAEVPTLPDIENQHGWTVGGFQVHSEGDRAVVVGGLDNLLKGAATQCLQVCGIDVCSTLPNLIDITEPQLGSGL